jgi:molybdopterin molybdotransferase
MSDEQLLTVEQAQAAVLEHIAVIGVERVALSQALGRLVVEPIVSPCDNPPWDNSAMDGFALRYADIAEATEDAPVALTVIEDIPAGKVGQKVVGAGQAARIMTGAPTPEGADTVVPVEDTRSTPDRVEVLDPPPSGSHIRRRGEDMREGETLIDAGTECGPGEIGVLASVQRTFVPVYRRPTVAVISTGDELVEIDQPLGPGQIVNSNSASLAALATACGAVPVVLPIAVDQEQSIRASVETALRSDLVISSGGVSVGDYDYVKKVLDDMGAREILWRVAMKPGKPLYFATIAGTPYFGLPGNPVSSMMSFLQFVRPAIRKASGYSAKGLLLPETRARMIHEVYNRGDRRRYLRAHLRLDDQGRLQADTSHRDQGSHVLTSMLGVDGLVVLEPEVRAAVGDSVRVQLVQYSTGIS